MKNTLLNNPLREMSKMTRKILAFLLLAPFLITSVGYVDIENGETEPLKCLEVIGIAVNEQNQIMDGVQVRLLKKNEEMEWLEVTSVNYHDHNFKFILDENEYYTIEVSKPGYVKRSVVVSTQLPRNISPEPLFSFGFEVMMFKTKKGMDDYYLDFPVALIRYNKKSKVFENNQNYTYYIKSKIKEEENKMLVENMFNGKWDK